MHNLNVKGMYQEEYTSSVAALSEHSGAKKEGSVLL